MRFAGIHKNSFIDYPGKVSCVLFLSGCNFNCPYCHNPVLVNAQTEADSCCLKPDSVYEFLENRKSFLDGVVISGGEPTLHEELAELCRHIKHIGYPVKLDTNGSNPARIKELISQNLVDYIAMDIKTDPLRYSPLIKKGCNPDDILSSIRMIMGSGLSYEFRTTCIKPLVDDEIIADLCRNVIQGAELYALQRFRDAEVLHPEFFEKNSSIYADSDLILMKALAEPWVQKCIVR
jgi:pyruvate formate lyase activating enzyme